MNLFTDYEEVEQEREKEEVMLSREKKMQQAILDVKKKYGKNAMEKCNMIDRTLDIKIETHFYVWMLV